MSDASDASAAARLHDVLADAARLHDVLAIATRLHATAGTDAAGTAGSDDDDHDDHDAEWLEHARASADNDAGVLGGGSHDDAEADATVPTSPIRVGDEEDDEEDEDEVSAPTPTSVCDDDLEEEAPEAAPAAAKPFECPETSHVSEFGDTFRCWANPSVVHSEMRDAVVEFMGVRNPRNALLYVTCAPEHARHTFVLSFVAAFSASLRRATVVWVLGEWASTHVHDLVSTLFYTRFLDVPHHVVGDVFDGTVAYECDEAGVVTRSRPHVTRTDFYALVYLPRADGTVNRIYLCGDPARVPAADQRNVTVIDASALVYHDGLVMAQREVARGTPHVVVFADSVYQAELDAESKVELLSAGLLLAKFVSPVVAEPPVAAAEEPVVV